MTTQKMTRLPDLPSKFGIHCVKLKLWEESHISCQTWILWRTPTGKSLPHFTATTLFILALMRMTITLMMRMIWLSAYSAPLGWTSCPRSSAMSSLHSYSSSSNNTWATLNRTDLKTGSQSTSVLWPWIVQLMDHHQANYMTHSRRSWTGFTSKAKVTQQGWRVRLVTWFLSLLLNAHSFSARTKILLISSGHGSKQMVKISIQR